LQYILCAYSFPSASPRRVLHWRIYCQGLGLEAVMPGSAVGGVALPSRNLTGRLISQYPLGTGERPLSRCRRRPREVVFLLYGSLLDAPSLNTCLAFLVRWLSAGPGRCLGPRCRCCYGYELIRTEHRNFTQLVNIWVVTYFQNCNIKILVSLPSLW
jgi:hypothetical protein